MAIGQHHTPHGTHAASHDLDAAPPTGLDVRAVLLEHVNMRVRRLPNNAALVDEDGRGSSAFPMAGWATPSLAAAGAVGPGALAPTPCGLTSSGV